MAKVVLKLVVVDNDGAVVGDGVVMVVMDVV